MNMERIHLSFTLKTWFTSHFLPFSLQIHMDQGYINHARCLKCANMIIQQPLYIALQSLLGLVRSHLGQVQSAAVRARTLIPVV